MGDLKTRFLALSLPKEEVKLSELGGETVWVWGLSGAERDHFESTMTIQRRNKREQNLENIRARFLVLILRDADGARLFSDADAAQVGNLPASILDRLFDVGRKLSGMTNEDVEELGKASGTDQPAP